METKTEPKSDTLSTVIRWLRCLASRIPENEKECRNLDALRLKMILRYEEIQCQLIETFCHFIF